MKCVKRLADGVVSRMTDRDAQATVSENPDRFNYASKSEWKAQAKNIGGRRKFYSKGAKR